MSDTLLGVMQNLAASLVLSALTFLGAKYHLQTKYLKLVEGVFEAVGEQLTQHDQRVTEVISSVQMCRIDHQPCVTTVGDAASYGLRSELPT